MWYKDELEGYYMAGHLETLFTTEQLAARLSITRGTLEKWRMSGKGPAFLKFGRSLRGGSVRYRLSDIMTWENSLPRTVPMAQMVEEEYTRKRAVGE